MKSIVVVGGGAGGLGLATQLGVKFKRRDDVEVILIDRQQTHLWKPLLHEVATGVIDSGYDELNYRFHGYRKHFAFQLGSLSTVDRAAQDVVLEPVLDEDGEVVIPERRIHYDYLVLALGSVSNDFNTPGVREHAMLLDSKADAEYFHHRLLNEYARRGQQSDADCKSLTISIVGGGATGVELAAELVFAARQLSVYGVSHSAGVDFTITLLEAGPRLLPALSERLAKSATRSLEKIGVEVRTATKISACSANGFIDGEGVLIHADICVWAAGVKGPDLIANLDLEATPNNRIKVSATMQSLNDPLIYAIGDCAAYEQKNGQLVPPRAQSAHQMASTVYVNIQRQMRDRPLKEFVYKDFGSLVSLSRFDAVGGLMGGLTNHEMKIKGRIARYMYISLYRMHQLSVHGWWHTILLSVAGRIHAWTKPRMKLH